MSLSSPETSVSVPHQVAIDIMEKENASLVDRPRSIAAGRTAVPVFAHGFDSINDLQAMYCQETKEFFWSAKGRDSKN